MRDAVASLSRAEHADPMLALLVCRLTASRAAGTAGAAATGLAVGMGMGGGGSGGGGGGGGFAPELGEAGVDLVRSTMLERARQHNDVWQQVSELCNTPVLSERGTMPGSRC